MATDLTATDLTATDVADETVIEATWPAQHPADPDAGEAVA